MNSQTLPWQGRCFRRQKCQKCGHDIPHGGRLAQLPVELLEMICEDLAAPWPYVSFPHHMFDLRLTCKEINEKTHKVFGKIAFSKLVFRLDYRDLNRIVEISNSSFASFAEFLTFRTYTRMDWQEYKEDKQALESAGLSRRRRRLAETRLHRARRAEEDENFVQCSSMDGMLLGSALQRMQNIRHVVVPVVSTRERDHEMPIRRYETGSALGASTTRYFSLLMAAIGFAKLKLHRLTASAIIHDKHVEGVCLSSLWMPRDVLTQLSELRCLELYVQTKDESFKNPSTWHTYLASFLAHCQQLRVLELGFRDDWMDTPEIFKAVAKKVKLPKLESLQLDYIRCTGHDLKAFLEANLSLHRLKLSNIDISGPTAAFTDILELLSTTMTSLKYFDCHQISQDSLRLYFENHGEVTADSRLDFLSHLGLDFFQDFTWVSGPSIYHGRAEEWEGVSQKLGLLKNDVVLGWKTYHSDLDGNASIGPIWMA
ncbi:hypothetical protein Tdes44962_MAKER07823 [Teratosphaeria destructans]|uniref:Uncharacterized protein n=1 Tax=Teratosphaeria destructans TaxID=418781 RepID=A0A9W7SXZ0_9PEZI|nr:hypothetical protein Tdes44962_MAKER07823 [Teratosphaeria destructans]